MTARTQVVFDAGEPHALAAFWADALHYQHEHIDAFVSGLVNAGHVPVEYTIVTEGKRRWRSVASLRHPDDPVDERGSGMGRRILFLAVPEPKTLKNRVHLDLLVGPEETGTSHIRLKTKKELEWPTTDSAARCSHYPGHADTLAGHLLDSAAALDGVPGCQLYVVSRKPGDADAVWAMEVWESVEALTELPGAEAVQKLIARARPVIVGMGERFELSASAERGWAPGNSEADMPCSRASCSRLATGPEPRTWACFTSASTCSSALPGRAVARPSPDTLRARRISPSSIHS